jgi:DNA primase
LRVKVATLPPGEDPDTLVKKGGVAALDEIVGDAVDLLERKIQLLERKGYFEDFDHRREAVDRLLPTIRAAADPITRELYLSLVSERTKISKEVLEHEMAGREPSGRVGSGAERRWTAQPPASSPPAPRARTGVEVQLLKALFVAPEWIERAREEIPPALFRSARLREVYEALLGSETATLQLPPSLSPEAQQVWTRLKEGSEGLQGPDQSGTYDRASQILRARPEYEQISGISDPGEKRQRRDELRRLYPDADRWYSVVRGVRAGRRLPGT